MSQPTERMLLCPIPNRLGDMTNKIMGAVIEVQGKWIFYKHLILARDVLRIRGVWGIDKRVLDKLIEEGVEEIHCYDEENGVLYVAPVLEMARDGEPLTLATTQVYLPMDRWAQGKRDYKPKRPAGDQVLT